MKCDICFKDGADRKIPGRLNQAREYFYCSTCYENNAEPWRDVVLEIVGWGPFIEERIPKEILDFCTYDTLFDTYRGFLEMISLVERYIHVGKIATQYNEWERIYG